TEYRGVGGAVIARYESLPPPYPQGWEPSFMFQQPPFERTIRRFLFDLSSVDVRLSTALKDFKEHDSHVDLTMAAGSGGARTLARALWRRVRWGGKPRAQAAGGWIGVAGFRRALARNRHPRRRGEIGQAPRNRGAVLRSEAADDVRDRPWQSSPLGVHAA